MVSERRRLRPLHVLEPLQVLPGQLAERDAAPPPLLGVSLHQRLVGIVLAHDREHPRGRLSLGQQRLRRPTTLPPPPAIPVRVHPRPPQSPDHGRPVPGPLPIPERPSRSLPNEGSCTRIRSHRTTQHTPRLGRNLRPGNGPGNCLPGNGRGQPSAPETPRSKAFRLLKSPVNTATTRCPPACHAGGRGFESRRSRKSERAKMRLQVAFVMGGCPPVTAARTMGEHVLGVPVWLSWRTEVPALRWPPDDR